MEQTVFFSIPLHRLKQEFQGWVKEAISEANLDPNILPNQKTILDTDQLMERLNVTRPTVQRWRDSGRIPYIQVGNVVRYDLDAVLEALSKKKGGKKC